MASPLCVCRELELSDVSPYKDTNPTHQCPTLMTSFNFECLLSLSPDAVPLEVRASTYEFGEDPVPSTARLMHFIMVAE